MPRYFFDINDGRNARDDVGVECDDTQAAVKHAKQALPEIAVDEVPKDGERQTLTILISEEGGKAVYVGSLTFTGTWLDR
jgi:hypothetical protein